MGYLIKVTIDGTDVTNYVQDYDVNGSIESDYDTANITLIGDVTDAIASFKVGSTVTVQRGVNSATDYYLFRGVISRVSKQSPNIIIECYDKLWALSRKEYTYSFDKNIDSEGGNVSKLFYNLVTTQGGLNSTWGTTIQDSGESILIDKFILNHDKIFTKLVELKNLLDWQMYYDAETDNVYFEPLGTTAYSGGSLKVGESGNVTRVPKWDYDFEQMMNTITVIGAEQLVETTELFSGDDSETDFQLEFVPKSVKVYVGGTLQVGGVVRSTNGTYNYTLNNLPDIRKVIFEAGSIPTTAVDNIEVRYTYGIPTPVQGNQPESVSTYGTFEQTKFYNDIKTVNDAENKLMILLDKYGFPFVKTKLETTGVFGLVAGMTVKIEDTINNENRTLLVKKTKHKYPEESDTIDVGDEDWRLYDWLSKLNDRIGRFEKDNLTNQRIIIQYTFNDNDYFFDNRYLKLIKRDVDSTAFILTHTAYGILGTSTLGGTIQPEVLQRLILPNDLYYEEFYDTDFKDTSETTATWNTTTEQVVFDA